MCKQDFWRLYEHELHILVREALLSYEVYSFDSLLLAHSFSKHLENLRIIYEMYQIILWTFLSKTLGHVKYILLKWSTALLWLGLENKPFLQF